MVGKATKRYANSLIDAWCMDSNRKMAIHSFLRKESVDYPQKLQRLKEERPGKSVAGLMGIMGREQITPEVLIHQLEGHMETVGNETIRWFTFNSMLSDVREFEAPVTGAGGAPVVTGAGTMQEMSHSIASFDSEIARLQSAKMEKMAEMVASLEAEAGQIDELRRSERALRTQVDVLTVENSDLREKNEKIAQELEINTKKLQAFEQIIQNIKKGFSMLGEAEATTTTCKVCYDLTPDTVFFPCKHLSMCQGCASHPSIKTCPVCRTAIQSKEKIFAS